MNCRILYLIGQLHSGGSERQLYYLIRDMDRSRYRPAVAVWNYSENDVYVLQIRELGVPIYSFQNVSLPIAKLRALRNLVKELKPEVLHSFSFYLNVTAAWSTLGTEAIAIGSMRSALDADKLDSGCLLGNISARWPRVQIYNSFEAAKCYAHSRTIFSPKKIFVVQNGLDLDAFRPSPLPEGGPIHIAAVGALTPVKRWDRLLIATAELKRRKLGIFVGIAGDGPLRQSLEQQTKELDIWDCVVLRGYTENVSAVLSSSAFLVHTSDAEGSPNAIMEAMACGRAVIAMDVGDVAALVKDGATGFVVPRGDDAMLVERMATLISNRDLCRSMGEAARTKAEREFRLESLVSGTLAAYRKAGWNDVSSDESGLSRAAEHIA